MPSTHTTAKAPPSSYPSGPSATASPTTKPTAQPTAEPTAKPTAKPTASPHPGSTATKHPDGSAPTRHPGASPTKKPGGFPPGARPGEQTGPVVSIVRGEAQPDECFLSIGKEILPIQNGVCPTGYRARTNQVYMWGFTTDQAQQSLWFASATLGFCGNAVTYQATLAAAGLGAIAPFDSDELTCEFDQSLAGQSDPSIGQNGDLRPPVIYQYDLASNKLINRTPDDPVIAELGGIRSAGAIGDIVFLAGVTGLSSDPLAPGNVVLLAFRSSTGEFLGSQEMAQYSNPKVFFRTSDNSTLYAGFALTDPADPRPGGTTPTWGNVLRWTGTESDPFSWEVVGELPNQPTYLQVFEGRLVANSWPAGPPDEQLPATVEISPPLESEGLTPADAPNWQSAFSMGDFFPDHWKAIANIGGGLQELDGWLYFGTATGAGVGSFLTLAQYPNAVDRSSVRDLVDFFQKGETAGHVWRIRNIGQPDQEIQLLYGSRTYWTAIADDSPRGMHWELRENLLHQSPLFGEPGFGNRWQYYSAWGSAKFRGDVYMGGFDSQKLVRDYLLNPQTDALNSIFGIDLPDAVLLQLRDELTGDPADNGADAWVFTNSRRPARPVTMTGFNNEDNWGARDWFAIGDQRLLVGTQGGWQYPPAADSTDPTPRRPGWQLLELFPRFGADAGSHR